VQHSKYILPAVKRRTRLASSGRHPNILEPTTLRVHLRVCVEYDIARARSRLQDYHRLFGGLKLYFEAETDSPNKYTIKSTKPWYLPNLPVTQTLFVTSNHNIESPMPRLLAIHRACCLILHLSGAGEYLDPVLRDMEEGTLRNDGTTKLTSILSLKLQQLQVF